MCKFTYLGYGSCDEPERHYLIRREKCSAKANLKHWCPPQDQDESPAADEKGKFWVSLPCPICADTPVVYDQPLLEIAHSRRSVLPAPHYDSVTGKYSRFAKHHAHHANGRGNQQDTPVAGPKGSPESLVPKPLKMTRFQVKRAASETSATRIKDQELSPDYLLPATTYSPSPAEEKSAIKTLPFPQPTPLTPPASRESSRSPPQHRIDAAVRVIPPGESSRHELASLRDRAKATAAMSKDSRPATPQSQRGASDRSRSGSESSNASSAAPPVLPPLPLPSRKISNASSNASSSMMTSSPPSRSGSETSRSVQQSPPHMRRKEAPSHSPPQQQLLRQDSVADNLAAAAMRPFERGRRPTRRDTGGSGSERSNSPVVWRPTISQPTLQQDSLGIGAGSDIIVEPFKQRLVPFRPSKNGRSISRGQGLVENPPRPKTRAATIGAESNSRASPPVTTTTTTTKTTALSLFPNQELDEKAANDAFAKMFETEQKAHAYQAQAQAQAMAQARAQTDRAMGLIAETNGGSGNGTSVITSTAVAVAAPPSSSKYNKEAEDITRNKDREDEEYGVKTSSSKTAAVARKVDKMLPNVPITTALRRIKTGQVKTVTVVAPSTGGSSSSSGPTGGRRPMKRSNTADNFTASSRSRDASSSSSSSSPPQISAPTNFVKVKTGGPLFSFAGVTGGKHGGPQKYAQEFEIVTGPDGSLIAEPTLGEAF